MPVKYRQATTVPTAASTNAAAAPSVAIPSLPTMLERQQMIGEENPSSTVSISKKMFRRSGFGGTTDGGNGGNGGRSPLPSSTKKKSGGGRKRLNARSPFGMLSPNRRGATPPRGRDGTPHSSSSVASSPSLGHSARKLSFLSPTDRRKRRPHHGAATGSMIKSALSPTFPGPSSLGRPSLSANKIKGSLRKDRKRHKSFSASASSKSNSAATDAGSTTAAAAHASIVIADDTMQLQLQQQQQHEGKGQELVETNLEKGEGEEEQQQQQQQLQRTAVMEFAYPMDSVAIPGPKVLQYFHDVAASGDAPTCTINNPSATHQSQLDALGTALLSLEDVVIPAAAREENQALKSIQAKLQRYPERNADVVDICVASRAYVLEMAHLGSVAAKTRRLQRESEFQAEIVKRAEKAKVERQRQREEVKAGREKRRVERRVHQAQEKERERIRTKKNHPRNKELWREVASLMKDVARLQKEERMWDEASKQLRRQECEADREMEERRCRADTGEGMYSGEEAAGVDNKTAAAIVEHGRQAAANAERTATNSICDLVTSAGRVDATLRDVADLLAKSNTIRTELYNKYRSDHQFRNYRGIKDTKGLIVALSQG